MPLGARHIVHPRVLDALGYHFPHEITIAKAVTTENDYNEPTTVYVDAPLMEAIPCYLEKNTTGNDEINRPFAVVVTGAYACVLQGYYPAIDRRDNARVNGTSYNIVDIANDGFQSMTVLGLERINKDTELEYSDNA